MCGPRRKEIWVCPSPPISPITFVKRAINNQVQGRGGGTGGQGDLLCALQMQRAALRSFARLHLLPNKQEENPSIEPAAEATAKKNICTYHRL